MMPKHQISADRPIRVIHIASGDLWAGAEAQLYSMLRSLRKDPRFALEVILLNQGRLAEKVSALGIPVVILDESRLSSLHILLELRKILRKARPDVVHTHRHKENILGALAAWQAGGATRVRTIHGAPEHKRNNLRRLLVSALNDLFSWMFHNSIIAVSRTLLDDLPGPIRRKTVFIPNGIDPDQVRESADSAHRKADRNPPYSVAFVGRLVPVKRIDIFIGVARSAAAKFPGMFQFHVFGDGPERSTLDNMIEADDSGASVQRHGFVSDLTGALADMDLLLVTSDHEGLPMTVLESVALHVPVIARNVGEIQSVLANGDGGHIVESASPEAFVDILSKFLEDQSDFLDRSRRAYRTLEDEYSASTCAARHAELYATLTETHRRNHP